MTLTTKTNGRILHGEKNRYQAVRSLTGVCGSYEAVALTPERTRVFLKAYDQCNEPARELIYRREVAGLRALAETDVTPKIIDLGATSPLLVTDWIDGIDLDEVIAEKAPFPGKIPAAIVTPIAHALSKIHGQGWVHRDVKPANIRYRTSDGQPDYHHPTVNDLGFAYHKSTHAQEKHDFGTLFYISPEQITNAPTSDQRSDVYALGIVLHQLMCGTHPYDGLTSLGAVVEAKMQPHNPRTMLRRADKELSAIVEKMTQPNPTKRYQHIDEVIEAFRSGMKPRGSTR